MASCQMEPPFLRNGPDNAKLAASWWSGDVPIAGRDGSPAGLDALVRVWRRGRRRSIARSLFCGFLLSTRGGCVTTTRLDLSALEIACHHRGGEGIPVVLLHGNSCSAHCFERQFTSLKRGFALTAIDLPGHGASADALDPADVYSVPGYARVLIEAVDRLGLERAVFVGWSLGGHVLLEAADALPQAAGFMVVAAPPIGGVETLGEAFLPHPAMASLYEAELGEEDFAGWARLFFGCSEDEAPDLIADFRRTDGRARAALGGSIRPGGFRDEVEVVARLKQPLAVVVGESDPLVNQGYLRNLKVPNLWRGEVQVVTAAGHAPHWENAPVFNALLTAFVDDCVAL